MSRKRVTDFDRECKRCGAFIPKGQKRCDSLTHGVKAGKGLGSVFKSSGSWDKSLNSAHHYHLIQSIRNGSWARTGYRAAVNPVKDLQTAQLYQAMSGGFSISRHRGENQTLFIIRGVEELLFRAEISVTYWRSEFDGLMAKRLLLWLSGFDFQKTRDFMGLSRAELEWLDDEIQRFFPPFSARVRTAQVEYFRLYRRLKSGVASDIIRRRQKGYKQGQTLAYQRDDPFSQQKLPIYGREIRARNQKETDEPSNSLTAAVGKSESFEHAAEIIEARTEPIEERYEEN
jgi:hypothetical protein